MKLYRGSRQKENTVSAQKILPVDYHKFRGNLPEKAIWAAKYKNMAWIFGIFWQRMSLKINNRTKGSKVIHKVQIERNLSQDEMEETVYLYTLDGSTFHQVPDDSSEWYSLEDTLPANRKSRKVKDVLEELRKKKNVMISVNPKLGGPPDQR